MTQIVNYGTKCELKMNQIDIYDLGAKSQDRKTCEVIGRPRVAHDVVNPKTLELVVAKEILSELFDIRTNAVDEMICQRMEERTLYGQEFNL